MLNRHRSTGTAKYCTVENVGLAFHTITVAVSRPNERVKVVLFEGTGGRAHPAWRLGTAAVDAAWDRSQECSETSQRIKSHNSANVATKSCT